MLMFDRVLLGEHLIARLELALGEHLVLLEHRDRLFLDQPRQRVGRRAQVGEPALLGLLVPLLGVVVAVEDDLLVRRPASLTTLATAFSSVAPEPFSAVFSLSARSSTDSATIVLSTVFGKRRRLARAERAELELVAGEGERAGAVAVAAVQRQRRQHRRAEAEERARLRGAALCRYSIAVEDLLELGAEEDRDDRRRRLVGAEAVVLARRWRSTRAAAPGAC